MDKETINRYASELDDESYNSLYSKMICEGFFDQEKVEKMDIDADEIEEEGPSASVVGKIAVKVIELIEDKLSRIKTVEIAETQGDIKKLKYNKQFKAVASIVESLQESQGMNSKYIEIYLDNYEILTSKKKHFKRAFKDSDRNLLSMFYIGLVLYHIEMTTILSSCLIDWVETGANVDEEIDEKEQYRKVFLKVEDILTDEELGDFLQIDFREKLISESNVSADMILLYSETSINDTIRLFKLGLAKFLHKLSGFLRFIIYLFHYSKFTLQKKIQKINTVIELYDSDRKEEREQNLREAKEMEREYQVATIDAANTAEKEFEKEKVNIEDEEGFSL